MSGKASVDSPQKPVRRRQLVVFVIVAGVTVGIVLLWNAGKSSDQLLRSGRQAIARGRYADAKQYAVEALSVDPDSTFALLLAAEAASKLGQFSEAVEYWGRIPDDGTSAAVTARCAAGELLIRQIKHPSHAEKQFRKAIQQDADNLLAHDRLTYILGLATRSWELIPHQIAMLRLGDVTPRRLCILSLGGRLPTDPGLIREYSETAADDPVVLLGLAQIATADQKDKLAKRLLKQAVNSNHGLVEAQLRLGRVILDQGSDEEFAKWHASLPREAEAFPATWVLRGFFAKRQGNRESAARCFWEAIRRDANQQQANYQLGRLLTVLHRHDDAKNFLHRSQLLEEYVQLVYVTFLSAPNPSQAVRGEYSRLAQLAESLGLVWETYAWRKLATQLVPRNGWPPRAVKTGPSMPAKDLLARNLPESNPAREIDLSGYPLPKFDAQ